MYLRLTAFFACVLLFAVAANAAQIFGNYSQQGKSCAVTILGDIEQGDDNLFDILTSGCESGGVLLQSNGGHLVTGLNIGEMVRSRNLETAVSYDTVCASACAAIWLGGTTRRMFPTSLIGFHAAYVTTNGQAVESGPGNALFGAYMAQMGLTRDAILFATMAGPDEISWLNISDAIALGIWAELLTEADKQWVDVLTHGSDHGRRHGVISD